MNELKKYRIKEHNGIFQVQGRRKFMFFTYWVNLNTCGNEYYGNIVEEISLYENKDEAEEGIREMIRIKERRKIKPIHYYTVFADENRTNNY